MKKILLSLIIITTVLAITPSVFAFRETVKEGKKDSLSPAAIREEVRGNIKEDVKERKEGLLDKVKDFMKKNLRFEARVKGKITAIENNNFSLTGDDGTFQINVTGKTQLLMKFGGKSNLSEYSVGNEVMVIGKFTDETKTTIDAKVIRNLSIQKRRGAFFGKVTAVNNDNFVMTTIERGTQIVYFGTAKFVNRKEINIAYGDVKVGDRVRVKGVWDKTLNKINEVTQVKDFSIPVVVPTPTSAQ